MGGGHPMLTLVACVQGHMSARDNAVEVIFINVLGVGR